MVKRKKRAKLSAGENTEQLDLSHPAGDGLIEKTLTKPEHTYKDTSVSRPGTIDEELAWGFLEFCNTQCLHWASGHLSPSRIMTETRPPGIPIEQGQTSNHDQMSPHLANMSDCCFVSLILFLPPFRKT